METIVLGSAFGILIIIGFIVMKKLGAALEEMDEEENERHKEK